MSKLGGATGKFLVLGMLSVLTVVPGLALLNEGNHLLVSLGLIAMGSVPTTLLMGMVCRGGLGLLSAVGRSFTGSKPKTSHYSKVVR
ncbi:hypothetical protein LFL96_26125 [Paraburkholderia sp. D15]|uniref:hypothetical protein n=1 Tax=Paraburkholderia sp. D15 TaxID=2880218 RepID=UPI0024783359|nr:hypothetical protein [Paraburkholderia sp. D15]WGS54489.1 hypothetical protein LFL96_26125 [Paraburkholderia sp. D15]